MEVDTNCREIKKRRMVGIRDSEINEITSISFENDENPDPPENMIFVEGGIFQMGDRIGNGGTEELPLHQVTLNDFLLENMKLRSSSMNR